MEATDGHSDDLAPAQRLTPRQRSTLLQYARAGTVEGAAELLGLSPQTVKNHLSDGYRRMGVHTGPQAIYVLMGGEDAIRNIPAALPPHRRPRARAKPFRMPVMVDGEVTLRDLRDAARIGDAESGGAPLASFTELVDWLSYYIRPGRRRASSTT